MDGTKANDTKWDIVFGIFIWKIYKCQNAAVVRGENPNAMGQLVSRDQGQQLYTQ